MATKPDPSRPDEPGTSHDRIARAVLDVAHAIRGFTVDQQRRITKAARVLEAPAPISFSLTADEESFRRAASELAHQCVIAPCGLCPACQREAARDNAERDKPPAFTGTVDELSALLDTPLVDAPPAPPCAENEHDLRRCSDCSKGFCVQCHEFPPLDKFHAFIPSQLCHVCDIPF